MKFEIKDHKEWEDRFVWLPHFATGEDGRDYVVWLHPVQRRYTPIIPPFLPTSSIWEYRLRPVPK